MNKLRFWVNTVRYLFPVSCVFYNLSILRTSALSALCVSVVCFIKNIVIHIKYIYPWWRQCTTYHFHMFFRVVHTHSDRSMCERYSVLLGTWFFRKRVQIHHEVLDSTDQPFKKKGNKHAYNYVKTYFQIRKVSTIYIAKPLSDLNNSHLLIILQTFQQFPLWCVIIHTLFIAHMLTKIFMLFVNSVVLTSSTCTVPSSNTAPWSLCGIDIGSPGS